MEKLKLDLMQLNKALKTLSKALDLLETCKAVHNEDIILAAEDSVIQRFEYCYESFWKFLKLYLQHVHLIEDVLSSKKVFRACVKAEICSLEEGNIFIDMVDSRNETSHTYNIESARIILSVVPKYHCAMIAVIQRFNDDLSIAKH
ncbi:nucleotidyltransferase substrate binding protein [Candidatus Dependentiae bacterium]|nr:nucleotidyltransferase substrate binding protein [Candidatus Dependentiae bacterium]MCC7415236.1 nucleotidyltransferase substrate binding protein [Campylobacterota bacterium]